MIPRRSSVAHRVPARDARGAGAESDRVERLLRPLPALVAVHRVVAADDGREPFGRQLGEVGHGRMRRDVPAVGERVNPGPLLHALSARKLEQRLQVVEMRVDAALRDEAEQVDVAAALPGALERGQERWVLVEGAVADGGVHALQILEEDPAGADRQVTDLGVAHLSGRQADRLAGGRERRVRVLAPEPVEDGRPASSTALPGPGGAQPHPSRTTSVTRSTPRDKSLRRSRARARRRRRARRRSRAGRGARPRSRA